MAHGASRSSGMAKMRCESISNNTTDRISDSMADRPRAHQTSGFPHAFGAPTTLLFASLDGVVYVWNMNQGTVATPKSRMQQFRVHRAHGCRRLPDRQFQQ